MSTQEENDKYISEQIGDLCSGGGRAFPGKVIVNDADGAPAETVYSAGMSLRQYYAAAIIAGSYSHPDAIDLSGIENKESRLRIAIGILRFADSMIEAEQRFFETKENGIVVKEPPINFSCPSCAWEGHPRETILAVGCCPKCKHSDLKIIFKKKGDS
jgi:hypothetical protein